jgi:dipeptidyl aminopeptidase/acylaminoacyl peptidase
VVARIDLNAPDRRITELAWAPSVDWLAVGAASKDGVRSTMLVSSDGSKRQTVFDDRVQRSSLQWSADGNALYFLRGLDGNRDLVSIRVDRTTGVVDGKPHAVVVAIPSGAQMSIAADARQVYYTRETRYATLWSSPLQGPAATTRAQNTELTTGAARDEFPAVSPDGRTVLFLRTEGTTSNLYVVPITGGQPQKLTFLNSVKGGAAWSADSSMVAFCATADGHHMVMTMPATGGAPRRFPATLCSTLESEVPVTWSPRREILYQRPGNRTYYELDVETSREQPLGIDETSGWFFTPRVSADGATIAAFWNNTKSGPGLWLLPSKGAAPAGPTLRGLVWPLAWSRDNNAVYAYRHSPDPAILFIARSGTAPAVMHTFPGQRVALVPSLAPDLKTLVYSAQAIHADIWVAEAGAKKQ